MYVHTIFAAVFRRAVSFKKNFLVLYATYRRIYVGVFFFKHKNGNTISLVTFIWNNQIHTYKAQINRFKFSTI